MNEWMNEQMDWMNELADEWMNEWIDEWRREEWEVGWMAWWMNERMERMDRWMDEDEWVYWQMDELMNKRFQRSMLFHGNVKKCMPERKRKEEWESRRDGDRHAWFKLIPSLQFQQDLATSFLDFLLRSSQWGSEAEINGKRTVSFSLSHTHSHSSWHQFAFDWEIAAVEHKLITISKRPLCVCVIDWSICVCAVVSVWTAPSGLGLQTGVWLCTERERGTFWADVWKMMAVDGYLLCCPSQIQHE